MTFPCNEFGHSSVILTHHDGAKKESEQHQREHTGEDITRPVGQQLAGNGEDGGEGNGNGGNAQYEKNPRLHNHRTKIAHPSRERSEALLQIAVFLRAQIVFTLPHQSTDRPRQSAFKERISGFGRFYHVGRKESGDNAHCHHNRVEETARYSQ